MLLSVTSRDDTATSFGDGEERGCITQFCPRSMVRLCTGGREVFVEFLGDCLNSSQSVSLQHEPEPSYLTFVLGVV